MEITDIIVWIGSGSVVASVLIAWLKKFIKEKVKPRYGDLGIVIFLSIISIVVALGYWNWQFIPKEVLTTAAIVAGWAMLIYQALWKAIIQKAILGKLDKDEQ